MLSKVRIIEWASICAILTVTIECESKATLGKVDENMYHHLYSFNLTRVVI